MENICKLCQKQNKLQQSHLIPKFVFKWIKETGTGYLRGGEDFNRRIQDGFKTPLLCTNCENLFSKYETYFAKQIFYPVVDDREAEFEYSEHLYLFATSVLWRLLVQEILPEEKAVSYYADLELLEQNWRSILLAGKTSARDLTLQLLTGVDVAKPMEGYTVDIPDRFVLYMARGVDAGITDTETKAMLFVKLPRFLFLYPLRGFNNKDFINSAISSRGGIYYLNDVTIADPEIGDFFLNRVKLIDDLFSKMSSNQKEKLRKITNEKWPLISNKDLGVITKYQEENSKNKT